MKTLRSLTPSVRPLWRVLRILVGAYLLVVLLVMIFEEVLIFPAPRYPLGNWHRPDLDFEDVEFLSQDGTMLHGWFFAHAQPRAFLLYCHGNGDFVPNLGDYADVLRDRYRMSVFIFDYRGYGRSAGRPHEHGVLADARAARAWLARTGGIAESDVVLLGRSLGGAVAVDLAADKGARALVLENTFSSMPDVGAYHYPWLPVRLLIRTQLNARQRIAAYPGPLLQSHAARDEIVPLVLGQRLFDAAPGKKEFITIQDAYHNDPPTPSYYKALEEFFQRVLDL